MHCSSKLLFIARRYYPRSYYEEAVLAGRLRVNGQTVSPSHRIVDGQLLSHSVHRHPPPPTSLQCVQKLCVEPHSIQARASRPTAAGSEGQPPSFTRNARPPSPAPRHAAHIPSHFCDIHAPFTPIDHDNLPTHISFHFHFISGDRQLGRHRGCVQTGQHASASSRQVRLTRLMMRDAALSLA